jgi:hypothetical protein
VVLETNIQSSRMIVNDILEKNCKKFAELQRVVLETIVCGSDTCFGGLQIAKGEGPIEDRHVGPLQLMDGCHMLRRNTTIRDHGDSWIGGGGVGGTFTSIVRCMSHG